MCMCAFLVVSFSQSRACCVFLNLQQLGNACHTVNCDVWEGLLIKVKSRFLYKYKVCTCELHGL